MAGKRKTATPSILDGEHLVPSRVELEESSGPVSPRHQFHTRIVVEAKGDAITLDIEDERGWDAGEFRAVTRIQEPLSKGAYQSLWADLLAQAPFSLEGDLIGEQGRTMVGVSFNHLHLRLGKQEARIAYRLRDLSRSKFAAQARLVERVRGLRPSAES